MEAIAEENEEKSLDSLKEEQEDKSMKDEDKSLGLDSLTKAKDLDSLTKTVGFLNKTMASATKFVDDKVKKLGLCISYGQTLVC